MMHWTNPKRAIITIVLWSFAVHIPGLFSPLRDYDAYGQCQTASIARNYLRHGMQFLNPEVDTDGRPRRAGTEFPIYSYILAVFYKLFGLHEILGRLLSMLFAAWGAVYLYLFVKQRLGERIACWSALVMCSLPVHIYFTRTVQPEPMALWALLGFLYYADRWLHRYGGAPAWLGALVLGSLAPLLNLPFSYLLIPLWLALGYEWLGFKLLTSVAWMTLLIGIFIITAVWYSYTKGASVVLLPLTVKEHLANLAPLLTRRLWVTQFISRVPEFLTTFSGLVLGAIGFYNIRRAKTFTFFAAWLAASVLYVPLLGEYGIIHRDTLLPLTPLAAVWIACGISVLWEFAKTRPGVQILAILLILGIPLHASLRIKHWYRLAYGYLDRARATLLHVSKPNDLVLVASHEKPVLLYYLDHYGYAIEPNVWRPTDVSQLIHYGVRFIFIPLEENRPTHAKWKGYLKGRGRLIGQDPEYWLYRLS